MSLGPLSCDYCRRHLPLTPFADNMGRNYRLCDTCLSKGKYIVSLESEIGQLRGHNEELQSLHGLQDLEIGRLNREVVRLKAELAHSRETWRLTSTEAERRLMDEAELSRADIRLLKGAVAVAEGERDEARAEVSRLTTERDEARRECVRICLQRDEAEEEVERLRAEVGRLEAHRKTDMGMFQECREHAKRLKAEVGRLTRERATLAKLVCDADDRLAAPPPAPPAAAGEGASGGVIGTLYCALNLLRETSDCGALVRGLYDAIAEVERLEAVVAAAVPARPAAIVFVGYNSHEDELVLGCEAHAFESVEEAEQFAVEHGDEDVYRFRSWTHHPAGTPGAEREGGAK